MTSPTSCPLRWRLGYAACQRTFQPSAVCWFCLCFLPCFCLCPSQLSLLPLKLQTCVCCLSNSFAAWLARETMRSASAASFALSSALTGGGFEQEGLRPALVGSKRLRAASMICLLRSSNETAKSKLLSHSTLHDLQQTSSTTRHTRTPLQDYCHQNRVPSASLYN